MQFSPIFNKCILTSCELQLRLPACPTLSLRFCSAFARSCTCTRTPHPPPTSSLAFQDCILCQFRAAEPTLDKCSETMHLETLKFLQSRSCWSQVESNASPTAGLACTQFIIHNTCRILTTFKGTIKVGTCTFSSSTCLRMSYIIE